MVDQLGQHALQPILARDDKHARAVFQVQAFAKVFLPEHTHVEAQHRVEGDGGHQHVEHVEALFPDQEHKDHNSQEDVYRLTQQALELLI